MNIYDIYKNPVGKIYADVTGLDIIPAIITAVEAAEKPEILHHFYFEAVEAGSTFRISRTPSGLTYEYSQDEENWTSLGAGGTITLANIGDRAYIRQTSDKGYWCVYDYYYRYNFITTGNLKVGGCISTLAYNDIGHTSPTQGYALANVFYNCKSITDASDLKLDFTELTNSCYSSMFYGCTNLKTAPKLPATKLAITCYYSMFNGCTSLVTAPKLPTTKLANQCYQSMFYGCTNLKTAPSVLPATELTEACYLSMFEECSSLTTAPKLPATKLANQCYQSMFNGCTSLVTAPELPATILAENCYWSMFSKCKSLTTAPSILPATILAENCYYSMFNVCTSLTTAPELHANELTRNCFHMFDGCTNLNSITIHATSWDTSYPSAWVRGVSQTGTFTCPSSLSVPTGDNGIPSGWTRVDL